MCVREKEIKTEKERERRKTREWENSNQLLSKNKLHSLNSTYNFWTLKNLQFRFQEKNLNLNRDSNLRSPDH